MLNSKWSPAAAKAAVSGPQSGLAGKPTAKLLGAICWLHRCTSCDPTHTPAGEPAEALLSGLRWLCCMQNCTLALLHCSVSRWLSACVLCRSHSPDASAIAALPDILCKLDRAAGAEGWHVGTAGLASLPLLFSLADLAAFSTHACHLATVDALLKILPQKQTEPHFPAAH